MADIISTDPNKLLEDFQTAYYNQIGKRMTVGSEEYTLSSAFTYVLSQYAALINASYKNQIIETANGVFLDNIAARYNLSRKPEAYSNPWFEGRFYFSTNSEHYDTWCEKNTVSITVGGHIYKNDERFAAMTDVSVRFVCTEPHNDYSSKTELIDALKTAKDHLGANLFDPTFLTSYRISEMQGITHELTDDELREYIKSSKQLYVPGVAGAFEALAKASSKDIVDARVLVQGDNGFVPGNVDLYCKPYNYTYHSNYAYMVRQLDIPRVLPLIEAQNLAVIGQTVSVYEATPYTHRRSYAFYCPKAYETNEYTELYKRKFRAVVGYLNNRILKIGEPYAPSIVMLYMARPLSEISTNPVDFGFVPEDGEYQAFERYEALPVLGFQVSSDYVYVPGPTEFVRVYYSDININYM